MPRAWTVSVGGSAFVGQSGTIPATNVSYASGPATSDTTGLAVPGQATALLAQPLSSTVTAFTGAFGLANGTVSWNPTIVIQPPAGTPAGSYSGTITHSIA